LIGVRARCAALTVGIVAVAALPTALIAQRGEVAVLGGIVHSAGEEFDRVTSTQMPPPTYTRQRGLRTSGAAVGAAATFAIRGHVFGELGIMRHGVERRIARTALGDPNGPFDVTTQHDGALTSFWVGPSYRVVDRARFALSALAAPVVLVMSGDAYDQSAVGDNTPSRRAALGALLGLRARLWLTQRLGAQLAIEDALWTMPLLPHPTDGTPLYPGTSRSTPRQHDLRLHVGAAYRLF
jgi:hypothetical protein